MGPSYVEFGKSVIIRSQVVYVHNLPARNAIKSITLGKFVWVGHVQSVLAQTR